MSNSSVNLIGEVSAYIAESGDKELPTDVVNGAKQRILDSLAAMVSGSQLKPGKLARQFVESQLGKEEAQVVCSSFVTTAINAALANGIMAHADETDDFMPKLWFHPGSVIVPAALSMAEREGADGTSFLRAIVVGYDIGSRIIQALVKESLEKTNRDSHCMAGSFGAAAAACSILRLEDTMVRHALSYAAQQASGLNFWTRDVEHIEKAFLFSGMPARNGITAALMVQGGFTGTSDPFSGESNLFEITSPDAKPDMLVDSLGSRFAIMESYMKKYPVGGPIQAAIEGLSLLMEKHNLGPKDIKTVDVYMPKVVLVAKAKMPNVNLPYLFAVTLIDGELTFEASHSHERMNDPEVVELGKHIRVEENRDLFEPDALRQAIVEIKTNAGTEVREHVKYWRGTPENPMSNQDVEKKCQDLMSPILGINQAKELIDRIWNLEKVGNIRDLRPLLRTP
ncbi:MmgE/PrpD family protein [Chloroflexota bacterium]